MEKVQNGVKCMVKSTALWVKPITALFAVLEMKMYSNDIYSQICNKKKNQTIGIRIKNEHSGIRYTEKFISI